MLRIQRTTLAMTLLLSQGCCGSTYLSTVGKFAETASASTSSLLGVIDISHRTCEDRAQIDYLQHRLEQTNFVGSTRVHWRDWYTTFKFPTGSTWEQQCKAFQTGDSIMAAAIVALSNYADALAMLAKDDNYDGKDMSSLTDHTKDLLATSPAVATPVTDVVKSLGGEGGPIAKLAGTLKQAYAAKEVVKITNAADEAVRNILRALDTYITAVGLQETQWENEARTVLDSVDRLLAERHSLDGKLETRDDSLAVVTHANSSKKYDNPLELLEFHATARDWLLRFDTARSKQRALKDTVQKLSQAEQKLVAANGDSKSPHLQTVLGLVSQISANLILIQSATREGAGK